jgi:hypothetical protein
LVANWPPLERFSVVANDVLTPNSKGWCGLPFPFQCIRPPARAGVDVPAAVALLLRQDPVGLVQFGCELDLQEAVVGNLVLNVA